MQTSNDPERQYSPLVLAQSAKMMDIDAKVYYLGQALQVLTPEASRSVKIGTFPNLDEMLTKTLEMGIEIYVCEASKRMLGWDAVTLREGLKIVGAATLNDLVLEADATMWF